MLIPINSTIILKRKRNKSSLVLTYFYHSLLIFLNAMPLKTFNCDLLESQNCDEQGMIKGNVLKKIQTL